MRGFCDEWKRKNEALQEELEQRRISVDVLARRLSETEREIKQLTYERDRARMMAESSGSLAEYRMRQIFGLQAEISHLKGEAL